MTIQVQKNKNSLSDIIIQTDSKYKRYRITSVTTPHRKKIPHPFWPSANTLGLIKYIMTEAFHLNFKLLKKKYRNVLFQRPCIYGVFDRPLGGITPSRQKCVGCMRCVQETPEICKVERNEEFYSFCDEYWIPDNMKLVSSTPYSLVLDEALTGKIPVRGMGYKGTFGSRNWDTIWTDMSEIVRPTRDGVYGREFISLAVDLGRKQTHIALNMVEEDDEIRTIASSLPFIIDKLPISDMHPNFIKIITQATKETNSLFIVDYNDINKVSVDSKTRIGVYISDTKFLQYNDIISKAPFIEIPSELLPSLDLFKEIYHNKLISLRVKLVDNYIDVILEAVNKGIDIIHIESDYHGKTYETKPEFIKEAIRKVHISLVANNIRDKISLISSGGITLAEHIPKAILCGSDAVAINTSILIALQCEFKGNMKNPATTKIIDEKIDVDWGVQRIKNLFSSWHDQCIEILSAMGIRDIRRLRGDVGRAIFKEDIEKEAFIDLEVI